MEKQKKALLLRQSHTLNPSVTIAEKGLSETVLIELENAFKVRELIKVKFSGYKKAEIRELINGICASFNVELIQQIGHVGILYCPKPVDRPKPLKLLKRHKQSPRKPRRSTGLNGHFEPKVSSSKTTKFRSSQSKKMEDSASHQTRGNKRNRSAASHIRETRSQSSTRQNIW